MDRWPDVAADVPAEWRGGQAVRVSSRVWKLIAADGRAAALKLAAPGAPLDVEAQSLAWLSRHDCPVPRIVATSGDPPLRWLAAEWCGDATLDDVPPTLAPRRREELGAQLASALAAIEAAFGRLSGASAGRATGQSGALLAQAAPWIAAAPDALGWLVGRTPAAGLAVALERALQLAAGSTPTLGALDYNPRNVVLGNDALWIEDFAAVGADWAERRFAQYGTLTGAGRSGGNFSTVIGDAAVRRFAAATAAHRGLTAAAVARAVDGHDVLLLLTAAAQLRLVADGTAHPDRAAAWANVPERRQRLLALLARRLCDGGPAEEFRALLRRG